MNRIMPPKLELKYEGCFHVSHIEEKMAYQKQFDAWYAKEIAPLFENAVEVYNYPGVEGAWNIKLFEGGPAYEPNKALLVRIEPIAEQSAEDILKDELTAWKEMAERMAVMLKDGYSAQEHGVFNKWLLDYDKLKDRP